MAASLIDDICYRLPATIEIGAQFTTFEDYVVEAQSSYRVRSWAIFGGNPASAMYLYRYNATFNLAKVLDSGEGLIAAINGGTGYVNPIQYLLRTGDKLAVILGAAAGTRVKVNVELDFFPAGYKR